MPARIASTRETRRRALAASFSSSGLDGGASAAAVVATGAGLATPASISRSARLLPRTRMAAANRLPRWRWASVIAAVLSGRKPKAGPRASMASPADRVPVWASRTAVASWMSAKPASLAAVCARAWSAVSWAAMRSASRGVLALAILARRSAMMRPASLPPGMARISGVGRLMPTFHSWYNCFASVRLGSSAFRPAFQRAAMVRKKAPIWAAFLRALPVS